MTIRATGACDGAARKRPLRRMILASTGLVLLAGAMMPVTAAVSVSSATAAGAQPEHEHPEIIVTAPAPFRDVRPERELDQDGIASYGLSTVDELLAEIRAEVGDEDEPVFVVNGERVYDLDDIGGYPIEILRQLQVLPRGSALRMGGSPRQRVISLALHRQVRSATQAIAPRVATDGGWSSAANEIILTHVRGRSRGNITLRARGESALLESERGIIQPVPVVPYATGGNIIAYPDLSGEIDPLLSEAAGTTVTVVPVPNRSDPTLSDFAAAANQANGTDLGLFRTLRPKLRSYDLNATYTSPVTSWLTSTATLRLGRSTSRSRLGLPSSIFLLGADHPDSPFSVPVGLAMFGAEPLDSSFRRDSAEAKLTLAAQLGGSWHAAFAGNHSRRWHLTRTERVDSGGPIPIAASTDPFGVELSEGIALISDDARSRSLATNAQLTLAGSPLRLPAGDLTVTVEGLLGWRSLRATSGVSPEPKRLHRSEQGARAVLDLPLTSRRNAFLGDIGELRASAEYNLLHFSDAGNAGRGIVGVTWEPRSFLRLRSSLEHSKEPAPIDILGAPTIVTPSARLFDPLTGETVDVVYVSGGNPDLEPQSAVTRRLSATLRLLPSIGLQANGEYDDIRTRNFVSPLPIASEAIMRAFPERFVRDAGGRLTQADVRPVNFSDYRQRRLRYGLSLNAPLGGGGLSAFAPLSDGGDEDSTQQAPRAPFAAGAPPKPGTRVQLTANHSIVLQDEIFIRPGLDPVDLLDGGAIGLAGGRVRHELDATAAVSSGGTGVRVSLAWRGASLLESRIGETDGMIRFSPTMLVNLRAFADMRRFLPGNGWSRGSRLSVNVLNIANDRQRVRDSFGNTPLQYQPGYRDPLGRTIEIELRKVF